MIVSFRDEETKRVFETGKSRRFGVVARTAGRRLGALDFARTLNDLRRPPSHRLEQSKGDRTGQYSIRVKDQYRVCFRWEAPDAHDVELVDHH